MMIFSATHSYWNKYSQVTTYTSQKKKIVIIFWQHIRIEQIFLLCRKYTVVSSEKTSYEYKRNIRDDFFMEDTVF